MKNSSVRFRLTLEAMLIVITLGMSLLFTLMGEHRLMTLNLFYLPVILSGYYLGRTRAGILALLSALTITIAATIAPTPTVATTASPLVTSVALVVWSASLGLAALLVGTLCDERASTLSELQRAYVGVAEVLARYLQGARGNTQPQSLRVAELSRSIAETLRFAPKEIDDIRVAALLHDLGNLEITTEVISNAVGSIEQAPERTRATFMGTDLVQSLGGVLEGALPLLANQDDEVANLLSDERSMVKIPLGAHIIRVARAYDSLIMTKDNEPGDTPETAIRKLRTDTTGSFQQIVDALENVVMSKSRFVGGQNGTGTTARDSAAAPLTTSVIG